MSKPFFTSDLHLKHVNIIKYCDSRKHFKDSDEMTFEVIKRFNARVGKDDVVYLLGDIAMGHREHHPWLISQLNGYKILVYGNHDIRTIKENGVRRPESHGEIVQRWLGLGMQEVHESLTIEDDKYGKVFLRHIPFAGHTADVHLCGHVHEDFDRLDDVKIVNVGVDVRDLEPKTLDEIMTAPFKGPNGKVAHRPIEDYAKDAM